MQRIFKFCHDHAWFVFVCIILVTAWSVWSARSLRVNVSTDELIPRNSELWSTYNKVRSEFGSDQLAVIYIEDQHLFKRDKLIRLNELVAELRGLDGVERVESLFSVSNIRGSGGWVETGPLFESIPSSQEAIDEKKEQALKNPLLLRTVLSLDGRSTLISIYLEPYQDNDADADRRIYNLIEEKLAPFQADFARSFQVGSPALHTLMADFILEDQRFLLPVSGLLLVLLIGLLLGSVTGATIPVLNAAISTAWTLGIMASLDIPISMLNYIVPALILIIGSTEDVHILVEYQEAKDSGLKGADAIQFMASRIGLTLVLTGITTSLGFAVTGLNALGIMQEFGVSAAIGMATRFLVSVLFVPAFLRVFGKYLSKHTHDAKEERRHQKIAEWMSNLIKTVLAPKAAKVIAVFALIAIPSLILIPKIKLSNDLISFLHPDSLIVERLDTVANQLSGSKVIYITLNGRPGDFKSPKMLKRLENITNWLRERSDFDTVTSLSDYISLVNRAMYGDAPKMEIVPDNEALIAQYFLFFHRSDLRPYVTGDFSTANIVIRCNINDSSALNATVEEIRSGLQGGRFGNLNFSVTGKSVLVSSAVDKIVTGQVISLSTMVLTLFIIISVLFLSVRAGVMSVIANLFPVAIVFGLMALFGISLNIGTCMVAAITIGIAVDDTLHLMVRYNKQLKNLKNEVLAIGASVKEEFFPVLTTSLGLAGGFIVLGFSSFVPVMQFGFLSALVMVLALITDLILTPVLLSTIRLITLWDLLGFKLRETLINTSPMFSGMTKWQAKKLILLANVEEHKAGATVIREGETGSSMYVIIEGEMEVSKTVEDERIPLTTLKLGDLVGEVALVSETRRTADVTAKTDVRVLSLDWDSLVRLQQTSPYLSSRLFLNLSNILGQRLKSSISRIDSRAPFPNRK
ncbi:MMPL family transporter [Rubellicoccus peritrichatus]|uniref:MMPL family transporter n=1 Tax=Rubellicoccus peritrichatus TaxID=3080537 RepID=A0AAQ3L795_9BACT|nr:MMPL family transporter [Puniceicoccus sp. CR14]WOO40341.1 MMPL family transporter [Puniceicoccus sp. CR14]